MSIKQIIFRLVPKSLLNLRHLVLAWWGSVKYKHPADELIVIGVTGTSGKSSTIYFLRQILEQAGWKVGALSTIEFYVNGRAQLNDQKMTMLGRTAIQQYLREMVAAGCLAALIETTSEGWLQSRHRFINYDTMVLTNLYPEHIEAHGGFDNYKAAKLAIFRYAAGGKRKKLREKIIPKTSIINGDSEFAQQFLALPFDEKISFGEKSGNSFSVHRIEMNAAGIAWQVQNKPFHAPVFGEYNARNITAAIAVARGLGLDWPVIQNAVAALRPAPGRIEFIHEAEKLGFQVIVDYAFEPVAMEELYKVAGLLEPKRIIHVFGSTGGGRDTARRFTVGRLAGERADICIVTDEDPYDDDPERIIADVATAVRETGKRDGVDLFCLLDRQAAMQKAIDLARAGDVILITGKGSEQAMVVKGKHIPWDDRTVVGRCLHERSLM